MNRDHICSALGIILTAFGLILLSPAVVAAIYRDTFSVLPFVSAALTSITTGLLLRKAGGFLRNFDRLNRNEGFLIVALAWILTAVMGAIPYLFYDVHPLDAYFESVSGITTTGATIFLDFSLYPESLFFWRSLSQWLGGMGIIVLFIAILPQFKVAGRQMFFAEAPGPTEEKVTPRITHTAKALWIVYSSLTIAEVVCLIWAGMPPFDAVCNSFSTMAAGGFSPHPLSIMGYENSAATWIIIFFMFLAGSNFALQYQSVARKRISTLFKSDEFRLYSAIVFIGGSCLTVALVLDQTEPWSTAVREGLFQIISILTTTGFSSSDFALWSIAAHTVIFSVMLVGGCAGSAGGGIKVVRILLAARHMWREIVQFVHPRVVSPIKIDGKSVPDAVQMQVLGFLLFYIVILTVSSYLVTVIEGSVSIGLVGTAATIGNIGPGLGEIGPMGSYGNLSWPTKSIFIVNMLVGRLELIPFLAMLHPDFWKFKKHQAITGKSTVR